jgi:hypothetical protein
MGQFCKYSFYGSYAARAANREFTEDAWNSAGQVQSLKQKRRPEGRSNEIPHSYLTDILLHITRMSKKFGALLKTKELILEMWVLVVFEVAFFAVADG